MLVVYRKDTGEVLHYADHDGKVQPTLFGLYHACIKRNYPKLKLEDLGEIFVKDSQQDENGKTTREKLFSYSKVKVKEIKGQPDSLNFIEKGQSDPPAESDNQKKDKKIKDLEDKLLKQQSDIDELMKLVKGKFNN